MVKLLADSNSRLSSDSTANDRAPRRRLRDLTGLRLLRIIERQNRFKEIINTPLVIQDTKISPIETAGKDADLLADILEGKNGFENENITVIAITHDETYFNLADRRLHLESGTITQINKI